MGLNDFLSDKVVYDETSRRQNCSVRKLVFRWSCVDFYAAFYGIIRGSTGTDGIIVLLVVVLSY